MDEAKREINWTDEEIQRVSMMSLWDIIQRMHRNLRPEQFTAIMMQPNDVGWRLVHTVYKAINRRYPSEALRSKMTAIFQHLQLDFVTLFFDDVSGGL